MSRLNIPKKKRTIRGGIVTTIIVFGLLLIIGSVSIAVAFVYFRRKIKDEDNLLIHLNQLVMIGNHQVQVIIYLIIGLIIDVSTENNIDNVIIDANEHMPISNKSVMTNFLLLSFLCC